MWPSSYGGGCTGWLFASFFWMVLIVGLLVVAPVVAIGWFIIIGAVLAALGIGGGGA